MTADCEGGTRIESEGEVLECECGSSGYLAESAARVVGWDYERVFLVRDVTPYLFSWYSLGKKRAKNCGKV